MPCGMNPPAEKSPIISSVTLRLRALSGPAPVHLSLGRPAPGVRGQQKDKKDNNVR